MSALDEAIAIRNQLYYAIDPATHPELEQLANQLGALLPRIAAEALEEYYTWREKRLFNPPASDIDTYTKEVLSA